MATKSKRNPTIESQVSGGDWRAAAPPPPMEATFQQGRLVDVRPAPPSAETLAWALDHEAKAAEHRALALRDLARQLSQARDLPSLDPRPF